jgi:hypothetical protein
MGEGVAEGERAMSDLRFSWLLPEEFQRVAPVWKEFGWPVPHPQAGAIRVAEHEGRIVGIVSMDLLPHLGPVWIHPDHRRSREIWREGMEAAKTLFNPSGFYPGVIAIAEVEASEGILARLGMERAKGVLFTKRWR